MIENKSHKHRNKPHRMSGAGIMVTLILFFVEQGKEILLHVRLIYFQFLQLTCNYSVRTTYKILIRC